MLNNKLDSVTRRHFMNQVKKLHLRSKNCIHFVGCMALYHTIYSNFSVSPDDLSLRMGEYELNGTNEPHGHIDRKVQIVASHPKFDPKT